MGRAVAVAGIERARLRVKVVALLRLKLDNHAGAAHRHPAPPPLSPSPSPPLTLTFTLDLGLALPLVLTPTSVHAFTFSSTPSLTCIFSLTFTPHLTLIFTHTRSIAPSRLRLLHGGGAFARRPRQCYHAAATAELTLLAPRTFYSRRFSAVLSERAAARCAVCDTRYARRQRAGARWRQHEGMSLSRC